MSKNRLLIELNSDKLKHTSRAREETEGGGGDTKEREMERRTGHAQKRIQFTGGKYSGYYIVTVP